MAQMIPSQPFWKLSWDSERPAISYFTLGKMKKYAGARFGE
jgi:hypothetical protein